MMRQKHSFSGSVLFL